MIHDYAIGIGVTLAIVVVLVLGGELGAWSRRAAARWTKRSVERMRGYYQLQSVPVELEPDETTWISLWTPRGFVAEELLIGSGGKAIDVRACLLNGSPLRLGKLTGDDESSFPIEVPPNSTLRVRVTNSARQAAQVSVRVEGQVLS